MLNLNMNLGATTQNYNQDEVRKERVITGDGNGRSFIMLPHFNSSSCHYDTSI
jgi:hypothetical protein